MAVDGQGTQAQCLELDEATCGDRGGGEWRDSVQLH